MRLNIRTTAWLALALAALLAGTAVADDRDFLRKLSAPPNLIFILDTSGSMVGSPEEPGYQMNSRVPYGMVPGAGDDYYSRMGIAKRVLKEFLADVTDANYVLAGYAQEHPADGSNPIPTKHWVYEAVDQDHFHLVEQQYAYRLGYAETHSGIYLDNPADIYRGSMIGYTPYFDPETSPVADRFGPVRAFDTNPVICDSCPQYDLMPVYFGSCIDDPNPLGPTQCGDGIFPFYDTGELDGNNYMITDVWYYGDATFHFPDCVAWKTPTFLDPDDGCLSFWEDNTGTIPGYEGHRVEYKRRIHLEIPAANPNTGLANHPLGILDPDGSVNPDGTGYNGDEVPVGNELVADLMTENYDLDATTIDMDYDEDMAFDWVLYVDSVEQMAERECGSPRTPTDTPTPSDTPTASPTVTDTPTDTPTATDTPVASNTPTPLPFDCSGLTMDPLFRRDSNASKMETDINNNTTARGFLFQTTIWWEDTRNVYGGSAYISYLKWDAGPCDGDDYWNDNIYNSPADVTVLPPLLDYDIGGADSDCDNKWGTGEFRPEVIIEPGETDVDWEAFLNSGKYWVGETCVQLDFIFFGVAQDGGDVTCYVDDCMNKLINTPTRTPTATPRPPTNTPSNTPTGPTKTPTPTRSKTPTSGSATNTPTRSNSPTSAAASTNTPTSPPAAATNTPVPPTATNTPNIDD